MRIKFNSDDELSLNKTIEFPTMTIVDRIVFHEKKKHDSPVLSDECLHKL